MGVSKTININNNTSSAISISRVRVFLDDGSGSTLQLDTNNSNFPNSITRSSSQIFFNAPNYGTGQVNIELIIDYDFTPALSDCVKTQIFNFVEIATITEEPIPSRSFQLETFIEPNIPGLAVPPGIITKTPNGFLYPEGTTVKLEASSNSNWNFVSWKDKNNNNINLGTSSVLNVLMNSNKKIIASFSNTLNNQSSLGVEVDQRTDKQNGSVQIFDEFDVLIKRVRVFDGFLDESIVPGSKYRLVAIPDFNNVFESWAGSSSSLNKELNITVNGSLNYVAIFKSGDSGGTGSLTVNVNHLGKESSLNNKVEIRTNGSTIGNATSENEITINDVVLGTKYLLYIREDEDWRFTNWSGDNLSNITVLDVTINDNVTFTANFEKKPIQLTNFTIRKLLNNTLNGIVGVLTAKVDLDTTDILNDNNNNIFNKELQVGSALNLSATPKEGYRFVEWFDNNTNTRITTNNDIRLIVSSNRVINAVFDSIPQISLTITKSGGDGVIAVTGDENYSLAINVFSNIRTFLPNKTLNFVITPKEGQEIDSIIFNNASIGTTIPFTKNIISNSTLNVSFKDIPPVIQLFDFEIIKYEGSRNNPPTINHTFGVTYSKPSNFLDFTSKEPKIELQAESNQIITVRPFPDGSSIVSEIYINDSLFIGLTQELRIDASKGGQKIEIVFGPPKFVGGGGGINFGGGGIIPF